jgi:hypothetical protein
MLDVFVGYEYLLAINMQIGFVYEGLVTYFEITVWNRSILERFDCNQDILHQPRLSNQSRLARVGGDRDAGNEVNACVFTIVKGKIVNTNWIQGHEIRVDVERSVLLHGSVRDDLDVDVVQRLISIICVPRIKHKLIIFNHISMIRTLIRVWNV